ncbi:MAG: hypothetical protein IK016_10755 [Lachnospiraceae bacterium]|nr:hypothetical protein [Lachnospiraceae bacterium]
MVNKLYPFEKNRYYPGKMLSSADFQAEQNYLVNKSRFMNHLMYGAGIVCGLSTISLDDLSVLVESGVAIDGEGREIIIGNSVVHKLSAIEGFSSLTGDEASLYIRFREEPVHSVYSVSRGDSDKEYEYNRVQEGYELYLTDKVAAGAEEFLETEFLLRDSVFSSEHFSAEILVPAIVSRERNMRIRLEIKKRSAEDVRLTLRGVLETPSFTTADGAHELEFSVDEVRLGKGEVLYRDYWMYVADEHSAETNVILKSGSAAAEEDGKAVNAAQNFSIIVRLSDRSPIEIVNDEVGRLSLEMREAAETSDGVKIADIRLSRTKNSYIIEEVRESGVRDYIVSPAQTVLRNFYLEYFTKDVNLSSGGPVTGALTETESKAVRTTMPEIATGVLEISLGKNARAGDIRYSGEIAHGLGRGNVYVEVGYEYLAKDKTLGASAKSTIYGNPELFGKRAGAIVDVETAVRVLNDKGSFVVAAKLKQDVDFLVLTYRWVAVRFPAGEDLELIDDFYDKSISATTPTVTLGTKESHFFGVEYHNMKKCSVTYELTASGSGEITADGVYTAPMKPGVYEIRIYCTDMPVICTYAYAIVKKHEHLDEKGAAKKKAEAEAEKENS